MIRLNIGRQRRIRLDKEVFVVVKADPSGRDKDEVGVAVPLAVLLAVAVVAPPKLWSRSNLCRSLRRFFLSLLPIVRGWQSAVLDAYVR